MKKIFILFLAAGLFTACNNGDNPFAKKNDKEKTEKDESGNKDDKKKGGFFGKADDENDGKNKKVTIDDNSGRDDHRTNNWTTGDHDKWISRCEDELRDNRQAKLICACAVDKLEIKYPDIKDADNLTEAEGQRLIENCTTSTREDDGYKDDPYKNKDKGNEDAKKEDNSVGSWTKLQREQYIKGCETTAGKNQGYTAQQIHSYCDCMTTKVERKYTFLEAAKMTAQDFQTREWQKAAADCMPPY